MRARVVSLTVAGALALVPAAEAAQRFASPGGSGAACSQALPCTLKQAIEKAKANDEVIVAPGEYTVPSPLSPEDVPGVDIHGQAGVAPPLITGSGFGGPLIALDVGGRLSHVDLRATNFFAAGARCETSGIIERVRSLAVGEDANGIELTDGCLLRNSLALGSGVNSTGVTSFGQSGVGTSRVRNVTAIASGEGSTGISATFFELDPGSQTVSVSNAIASGEDLDVRGTGEGGGGHVAISYSNFRSSKGEGPGTVTLGAGNQTAPPLFAGAAAGDYREAPGSPTIDAGIVDAEVGALDLAGNPRTVGGTIDIGAYEFAAGASPPPLVTPRIRSLAVKPGAFRAANIGGAVVSAKGKAKAPVAAAVSYSLNVSASVGFTVERRAPGRRAGRKCVKPTKANGGKAKCTRFLPVKGGFTHLGAAGANKLMFSGRIGGGALKPGAYRLTAAAGDSTATAGFKIVK